MHDQVTSEFSVHLCIHQLFEARVARSPEATSLVFEGETLSYGEQLPRLLAGSHVPLSRR